MQMPIKTFNALSPHNITCAIHLDLLNRFVKKRHYQQRGIKFHYQHKLISFLRIYEIKIFKGYTTINSLICYFHFHSLPLPIFLALDQMHLLMCVTLFTQNIVIADNLIQYITDAKYLHTDSLSGMPKKYRSQSASYKELNENIYKNNLYRILQECPFINWFIRRNSVYKRITSGRQLQDTCICNHKTEIFYSITRTRRQQKSK